MLIVLLYKMCHALRICPFKPDSEPIILSISAVKYEQKLSSKMSKTATLRQYSYEENPR